MKWEQFYCPKRNYATEYENKGDRYRDGLSESVTPRAILAELVKLLTVPSCF